MRSVADTSTSLQHHTWDIADTEFPSVDVYDEFVEYPTGYVKYVYSSTSLEARTHQSGWAARNANNHNQYIVISLSLNAWAVTRCTILRPISKTSQKWLTLILKKSCIGVLLCDKQCAIANGSDIVRVRPSICDKARSKQINQPCPNELCTGRLYLRSCRGHSGYPVTHFWRHVINPATNEPMILFQAKGEHDHPRPQRKAATKRQHYRRNCDDYDGATVNSRYKQTAAVKPTKRRITPNLHSSAVAFKKHHDVAALLTTNSDRSTAIVVATEQKDTTSSFYEHTSQHASSSQYWSDHVHDGYTMPVTTRPSVIQQPLHQQQFPTCNTLPVAATSTNKLPHHSLQDEYSCNNRLQQHFTSSYSQYYCPSDLLTQKQAERVCYSAQDCYTCGPQYTTASKCDWMISTPRELASDVIHGNRPFCSWNSVTPTQAAYNSLTKAPCMPFY